MGKIVLEEMRFYAFHGYFKEENQVGGNFVVDVEIDYPFEGKGDELSETVDYTQVYSIVARHMQQPAKLIEYVAGEIKHELQIRFPAGKFLVRLSKLSPPVGGPIGRTYVEV